MEDVYLVLLWPPFGTLELFPVFNHFLTHPHPLSLPPLSCSILRTGQNPTQLKRVPLGRNRKQEVSAQRGRRGGGGGGGGGRVYCGKGKYNMEHIDVTRYQDINPGPAPNLSLRVSPSLFCFTFSSLFFPLLLYPAFLCPPSPFSSPPPHFLYSFLRRLYLFEPKGQ